MNPSRDVLTDVLDVLRIRGTVLLRESYAPPWAVSIPAADGLAPLLGAGRRSWPVAFHYVERGQCVLRLQSGDRVTLSAGELALCLSGQAHQIGTGRPLSIADVADLIREGRNPFRPAAAAPADTALICGAFLLEDLRLTPLWASMAPVVHVRPGAGDAAQAWGALGRLLSCELDRPDVGSAYIVERLLEALCADAIRRHAQASPLTTGWLAALNDTVISKALTQVHQKPGHAWSVETLAGAVALSPSRFAARFTAVVGLAPMAYVTAWRMQQAVRMLRDGGVASSEVALRVGYQSAAAFSRAFRRHIGDSPSALRGRSPLDPMNPS